MADYWRSLLLSIRIVHNPLSKQEFTAGPGIPKSPQEFNLIYMFNTNCPDHLTASVTQGRGQIGQKRTIQNHAP